MLDKKKKYSMSLKGQRIEIGRITHTKVVKAL